MVDYPPVLTGKQVFTNQSCQILFVAVVCICFLVIQYFFVVYLLVLSQLKDDRTMILNKKLILMSCLFFEWCWKFMELVCCSVQHGLSVKILCALDWGKHIPKFGGC